MTSQGFAEWLFSADGSGWLVALASVAALIISYLRRKKPNRVVIREFEQSSLVRVKSSVREKIEIRFDGEVIETLSQLHAEIFNEGSEVVVEPNLHIASPSSTRILAVTCTPPVEDFDIEVEAKEHKATVRMPYLNPVRGHDQRVELSILVEGNFDGLRISGSGQGWSTRRVPLFTPPQFRNIGLVYTLCWAAAFVLCYAMVRFVYPSEWSEFPVTALLLAIPMAVVVVGLAYWQRRILRRKPPLPGE